MNIQNFVLRGWISSCLHTHTNHTQTNEQMGRRRVLEVMDIFIILILLMVYWQVRVYLQIHQAVYIKYVQFLCNNYISIRLFKKWGMNLQLSTSHWNFIIYKTKTLLNYFWKKSGSPTKNKFSWTNDFNIIHDKWRNTLK